MYKEQIEPLRHDNKDLSHQNITALSTVTRQTDLIVALTAEWDFLKKELGLSNRKSKLDNPAF